MQIPIEELIGVFFRETRARKVMIVTMFAIVSLSLLGLGVIWPKKYSAETTIFADELNIIRPLIEGAAVTTQVKDRARIANELIFSRSIVTEVLTQSGLITDSTTPIKQESIIEDVKNRTSIKNAGKNLIRISYTDDDPVRSFEVTRRFADSFITVSSAAKKRESRDAYSFIDKQVKTYKDQLMDSEQRLKEFRDANVDNDEKAVNVRIIELRREIEKAELDLEESISRAAFTESQLSEEAEFSSRMVQTELYRARILELQNSLDTLRLNYKENYPDIISIKQQIAELDKAIETGSRVGVDGSSSSIGEGVAEVYSANPVYLELRGELKQAQAQVEAFQARIGATQKQLDEEYERAKRIYEGKATLSELTRDYQVNNDIYQDMLRRREKARISMNLDMEGQGLTFRIEEPARLPLVPTGLRFIHFLAAGPLLGILMPLGIIFLLLQLDPRIRAPSVISDKLGLPLMVSVPHLSPPFEYRLWKSGIVLLGGVIGFVIVTYATVLGLKLMGVI